MKIEFQYNDNNERFYMETNAIRKLINNYLNEIENQDKITNFKERGELFDYNIAFKLTKQIIPPLKLDELGVVKDWSERVELMPIEIKTNKLEIPIDYQPMHKYTLKERLKVLFKGKI